MITGPEIYKKDNSGKIRVWQYVVDGDSYFIRSGVIGGKLTESKPKKCKPKSQKTGEAQAFFMAEAEMRKKLRIDYHENVADVDKGPHVFLPMLSFSYKDLKPGELKFPIYSQPKFDGIRSAVHEEGAWSREGKRQPAFDFLKEEVQKWLNGSLVFDGELYGHVLKDNFNEISSLVRKEKNITDSDIEQIKRMLKYNVYDIFVPGLKFSDRLFMMEEIFREGQFENLVLAPTVLCHTQEEADAKYAEYLVDGYEGQILRDPDGLYMTDARPKVSIKRKQFITEEFPILRFEEGTGNWAGAAKAVFVQLEDGEEGKAGVDGDFALNVKRWQERDEYVNGTATIRYLNRTPDNKLRGGVAKDLVKGMRED